MLADGDGQRNKPLFFLHDDMIVPITNIVLPPTFSFHPPVTASFVQGKFRIDVSAGHGTRDGEEPATPPAGG